MGNSLNKVDDDLNIHRTFRTPAGVQALRLLREVFLERPIDPDWSGTRHAFHAGQRDVVQFILDVLNKSREEVV